MTGHPFADDRDSRRTERVAIVEVASGKDRNAQCSKIAGRDVVESNPHPLTLVELLVADAAHDVDEIVAGAHRPNRRQRHRASAGHGLQFVEQPSIGCRNVSSLLAGEVRVH